MVACFNALGEYSSILQQGAYLVVMCLCSVSNVLFLIKPR